MGFLFLNSNKELEELSRDLQKVLNLPQIHENESLNAYEGFYLFSKLMGMKIKLEYNSYDYEDDYRFMIGIDDDFISETKIPAELKDSFTEIVGKVISLNMGIHVGHELDDKVIVYK